MKEMIICCKSERQMKNEIVCESTWQDLFWRLNVYKREKKCINAYEKVRIEDECKH